MDLEYLLLGSQRALLGEVIPELRAVIVNYDFEDLILTVNFYYDCEVTNEIYDLSSCIATEISCNFTIDELNHVDENILEWRHPKKIPTHENLVFLRKE